jgi:hypothetical protein
VFRPLKNKLPATIKALVQNHGADGLALTTLIAMLLWFCDDMIFFGKVPYFRDLGTYTFPLKFSLAASSCDMFFRCRGLVAFQYRHSPYPAALSLLIHLARRSHCGSVGKGKQNHPVRVSAARPLDRGFDARRTSRLSGFFQRGRRRAG